MSAYKFKSEHKSANFRGKFCTLCNSVWELIPEVGIVKHPDFPSYGLEREDCAKCTKINPVAPHSPTLAEKAAIRHQNLGIRIAVKKNKRN